MYNPTQLFVLKYFKLKCCIIVCNGYTQIHNFTFCYSCLLSVSTSVSLSSPPCPSFCLPTSDHWRVSCGYHERICYFYYLNSSRLILYLNIWPVFLNISCVLENIYSVWVYFYMCLFVCVSSLLIMLFKPLYPSLFFFPVKSHLFWICLFLLQSISFALYILQLCYQMHINLKIAISFLVIECFILTR